MEKREFNIIAETGFTHVRQPCWYKQLASSTQISTWNIKVRALT